MWRNVYVDLVEVTLVCFRRLFIFARLLHLL